MRLYTGFATLALIVSLTICGCFPHRLGGAHASKNDDVATSNPSDVCSYLSSGEIADAVGYGVDSKDQTTTVLGDNGAPLSDCAISVSGSESGPGGFSGAIADFRLSFMTRQDFDEATSSSPRKVDPTLTVTPVLEHVPGIGDDAIWVAENKDQGAVTAHANTIYVRKGDVLFSVDPPFSKKGTTLKDAAITLAKLVASRLTPATRPKAAPDANEVLTTPVLPGGTLPPPSQNNAPADQGAMNAPSRQAPADAGQQSAPGDQQQGPALQQDSSGSTNPSPSSDSQSGGGQQQSAPQDPSNPQSQPPQGQP